MGCANEFPHCSICGYQMYGRTRYESGPIAWEPSLWQKTVVALIGPHEQYYRRPEDDPLSVPIIAHAASPCDGAMGYLRLYHSGRKVHLQRQFQSEDLFPNGPTGLHWCLGVHEACLTMASLVMKTSPTSQLRSLRDLWVTLDRRCEVTVRARTGPSFFHWLPLIPLPKRPDEARRRWGTYYIPDYHPGSYYNWWLDDPLVIPDLTSRLLSNLQLVRPHTAHPGSLQTNLDSLPQELRDRIISLLLEGTIGLGCTGMLPQSIWRELFVRIPFLWDLDKSLVAEFQDKDGKEWDWERLFRQVMARVQPLIIPEQGDTRAWNYDEVGLHVPPGFINRRRIWQLLEDMDPDEVEKYGLGEREDGTTDGVDDMSWEVTSDVDAGFEQDWGPVLDPSEINLPW
ncbi:hypothetical protein B0J15DRAFT_486333 [Fusarium solani]|uniref:Uncharacterized protein n=2 Tax=Fusarium solani TaxID=169388 RepID=A0A9P9KT40_FUSSL|nr:uncharacterized protein B0J15DRAFT_486333 [Fusarium solani]KAH7268019.1 hypothetical protein B0J15DRAFT_486333 [Fusarium solani]